MGLDMYLTGERYVSEYERGMEQAAKALSAASEVTRYTHQRPVTGVVVEVMYWRKANAIHAWFVDHVQGGEDECRPHPVRAEDLAELLVLLEEVLADREHGPEKLAPREGFFFGSLEVNEWYWQDVEETAAVLREVLAWEDLPSWSFTYRSSW
jgi:hypothetical protein